MLISDTFNPLNSTKLISLDFYLDEMIKIYNLKKFPKVLILNGENILGRTLGNKKIYCLRMEF